MENSIPYELMDTILSELTIGLTLVDDTGNIVYFNALAGQLLGWDKSKDNSILSCHKQATQKRVMTKLSQFTDKEWHRVINIHNHYIENTYSPVRIPARFTGAIIISKDVSAEINTLNKIKQNADTDFLTGLYNRNFFNDIVQGNLMKSRPYGIIMLDISGLKYINDHFGHEEGDRIIREAAEAIKSSVRDTDLVFRFGGDEFVILTSNHTAVLERIKTRIQRNNKIPTAENPAVLNLSLGFATSDEEKNFEAVLSLADKRMYQDKEQFYMNAGNLFKRN
jgi:diguanylate cyclase (GGDEF)-like protein